MFAASEGEAILEGVRSRPEFGAFREALDAYLREWGFRRSGELMLTVPSFQERRAELIDILKGYVAAGGESPADLLRRQAGEREAETARVLAVLRRRKLVPLLPWPNRATLARVLMRWARRSIALRERARLKQALLYNRLRRVVLAVGRRLVERGSLESAEDVFFLTHQEIDDLLSGSAMFPGRVKELVALRMASHAEASAMTPPDSFELPEGDDWSPRREQGPPLLARRAPTTDGAAVLRGVGACGGTVTGRAAVLGDVSEFARLAGREVLVTRQTDPGWGPVFPLIRGLVIERGGMLSHGAIIAREYGIPAVVGVRDATKRIGQGQVVTVNGDRGVVTLGD
jgi:pyruvate,water dikinase